MDNIQYYTPTNHFLLLDWKLPNFRSLALIDSIKNTYFKTYVQKKTPMYIKTQQEKYCWSAVFFHVENARKSDKDR